MIRYMHVAALLTSASRVAFAQSQSFTDVESLEKTLKSASDLSGPLKSNLKFLKLHIQWIRHQQGVEPLP